MELPLLLLQKKKRMELPLLLMKKKKNGAPATIAASRPQASEWQGGIGAESIWRHIGRQIGCEGVLKNGAHAAIAASRPQQPTHSD